MRIVYRVRCTFAGLAIARNNGERTLQVLNRAVDEVGAYDTAASAHSKNAVVVLKQELSHDPNYNDSSRRICVKL